MFGISKKEIVTETIFAPDKNKNVLLDLYWSLFTYSMYLLVYRVSHN